jgi:hypothetical protein
MIAQWGESLGRIVLAIQDYDAQAASHQGQCDDDVRALSQKPEIAEQLNALDSQLVRDVLREYGAWDDAELADHPQNLQRLLWIACGDINDGNV